jgi:hypothetical protein
MERDFMKELKAILRGDEAPPKPIIVPLFNIHKRSLPVGKDTIVVYGVSEEEAKRLIGTRFPPKQTPEGVIYYDIVSAGAVREELSVFHNPAEFIMGAV